MKTFKPLFLSFIATSLISCAAPKSYNTQLNLDVGTSKLTIDGSFLNSSTNIPFVHESKVDISFFSDTNGCPTFSDRKAGYLYSVKLKKGETSKTVDVPHGSTLYIHLENTAVGATFHSGLSFKVDENAEYGLEIVKPTMKNDFKLTKIKNGQKATEETAKLIPIERTLVGDTYSIPQTSCNL